MDIKNLQNRVTNFLQKYKYAVLVFMIGIVLMLLPNSSSTEKTTAEPEITAVQTRSMQEELEEILSCIQGAGKVKVLLTEQTGEETVYQKNEDISVSENASSSKTDAVIITDSNRSESGLVRQINPPQYLGAIILCQGADDPALKLEISRAVSKITGLGTDKIAVLKMK